MSKLSPEEIAALDAYAARNGRQWKARLREDWMTASSLDVIHHLRNVAYFGLRGLTSYRAGGAR